MAATRNQLLARLHCIKRDMGWSDEEYRDILEARAGVRSAAALDGPALARLVAALGGRNSALAAWHDNEWAFVDRAEASRRPLLRKLIMLARSAGLPRGGQVRYIEGIAAQMTGARAPLPMCDARRLWQIVAAMAEHVARREEAAAGRIEAPRAPLYRGPGYRKPATPKTWV